MIKIFQNNGDQLSVAMTKSKEEIRELVRKITAEIPPDADGVSDLKADIPFCERFNLDSMDFLDIAMELRKQHSIDVPEADHPRL
jgi:acyl carrier protein